MPSLKTPAPTFDDVWRTIQELALLSKETDRKFQDTDRKFQETDRKFQETERLMKESSLETERRFRETEHRFQETEREMKESSQETWRQIKAVNQQLGAQGNRLGEFVQEMVHSAVVRLFGARGLPVHHVSRNVAAFDDNGQFVMEIDLLVVNSGTAIAVECKSHLSQADVDEHLERLAVFKQHFPQYASCKLLGAVAAMVLPHEVGRYAYRRGLFVLAQSGDTIAIRNDAAFVPQEW